MKIVEKVTEEKVSVEKSELKLIESEETKVASEAPKTVMSVKTQSKGSSDSPKRI